MKAPLSFVCPLTRSDLEGLAAMAHCPQCDLDIPDLSNLTISEGRRVIDALRCAHELSSSLHFCSTRLVDEHDDVLFVDPEQIPQDLPPEVASLFDDRATFLLALSAVAALGFSLNSIMLSSIFSPTDPDLAVFVLDGDGPRFEPEHVEAHADAIDAGQEAWVTINLANLRADLLGVTRADPRPRPTTPGDIARDQRNRQARIEASKRAATRQRTYEALERRRLEHNARVDAYKARKKQGRRHMMGIMSGTD